MPVKASLPDGQAQPPARRKPTNCGRKAEVPRFCRRMTASFKGWRIAASHAGEMAEGVTASPPFLLSILSFNPLILAVKLIWPLWWLWQRELHLARHKLSESRIPTLETGIHSDGDGLFLRVRNGGSRQWFFIYRRGSLRRELGLGGYGQGTAPVSLKLARQKAEAVRDKLARGIDPGEERKPLSKPKTFHDCMEGLLASKVNEWTNAKHRAQWEMTLRDYAKPLHDMPVASIAMGDVKECLLPHWQERPETADRLRSRIQAVIDFAIAHEWRTAGNPARWRGLLDKVLPKRQKLQRGHHAALAYASVPAMLQKLRTSSGTAARAVEFLTLTAARSGEVRGATFDEIDLAAATWTVPAERMKMAKEHVVPLCQRALNIVEAMRQQATSQFLFGGGVAGKPVSETAMTKALRVASPDKAATLHGMRSAFRDWCGDETEYPREIAEMALAHKVGNAVELAYRRSTSIEKRRDLMVEWEAFCDARAL